MTYTPRLLLLCLSFLFSKINGQAQKRYQIGYDLGYTLLERNVVYASSEGFYSFRSTDGLSLQQYKDYFRQAWNAYQSIVLNQGVSNINLCLDLYVPKRDKEQYRPLLIFVHGGAFLLGDKADTLGRMIGESYSARGYVVASINYRLGCSFLGLSSIKRSIYRSIQDLRRATNFLTDRAQLYGIDSNRIYYIGYSAGAMAVLGTAFMQEGQEYRAKGENFIRKDLGPLPRAPRPRAVISLCGAVTSLDLINKDDAVSALLLHGEDDDFLPLDKGFPFRFLIGKHFANFSSILYQVYGSRRIQRQMQDVGLSADLYILSGVKHDLFHFPDGSPNNNWEQIDFLISNFLLRHL